MALKQHRSDKIIEGEALHLAIHHRVSLEKDFRVITTM